MKKGWLIVLITSVLAIIAGVVIVQSDWSNETKYYYEGQLLLDSPQYQQFKQELVDYGIKVKPDDITVAESEPKLVIFDIQATGDFSFGVCRETIQKEVGWVFFEVYLIAFATIAILLSLVCGVKED